MTNSKQPTNTLERHAQTIAIAIIIGLITWVGISVTGNTGALATLTERSEHQSRETSEIKATLKEQGKNQYTIADALRDNQYVHIRMDKLDTRITTLEAIR